MYKITFVLAIVILSFSLTFCTTQLQPGKVSFEGRQLLVDGAPFLIKGICYHPVEKGVSNRSFERIDEDLALMQEAGINTIRVYVPVDDKAVLDKIHNAGMKIIISFGYNQDGFYDILSGSFLDYVKKYKDHPAILFWELGNEYNYHPEWFDGDLKNWYKAMNDAAMQIKAVDLLHPIATAHGELPDSLALAMGGNIDVWGMNVYRWDNPESIFEQWTAISDKPMYFAEAGGDSYMTATAHGYEMGPNQKAQADANRNILNAIFRNTEVCSGVALFAYSDEWWKAGNPGIQEPGGWAPQSSGVPYDGTANEEYWGIVDVDRNKKETFQVVKEIYNSVK
jgi:hypothetical protein